MFIFVICIRVKTNTQRISFFSLCKFKFSKYRHSTRTRNQKWNECRFVASISVSARFFFISRPKLWIKVGMWEEKSYINEVFNKSSYVKIDPVTAEIEAAKRTIQLWWRWRRRRKYCVNKAKKIEASNFWIQNFYCPYSCRNPKYQYGCAVGWIG